MEEKDTFRKLIYICAPDPKLDNFIDDGYDFDADFIIHNEHLINQLAAFAYNNDRIPLTFSIGDIAFPSDGKKWDDIEDIDADFIIRWTRNQTKNIRRALRDKNVVMGKCEEVWVLTENGVTPSMESVIDRAKLRHKKVLYFKVAKDQDQIFEEVGGVE